MYLQKKLDQDITTPMGLEPTTSNSASTCIDHSTIKSHWWSVYLHTFTLLVLTSKSKTSVDQPSFCVANDDGDSHQLQPVLFHLEYFI